MAKDNGYNARFIFISPPTTEELEARLKKAGVSEEHIQSTLKSAEEDIEHSKSEGQYDTTITNDDMEEAYKQLEAFIYGPTGGANGVNGDAAATGDDVAMKDASNGDDAS